LNAPSTHENDPFLHHPAAAIPYDVKGELPPGRAFRQHVPLLSGEGYINFHPFGDPGIPLSGEAMLAFQALPLGCAKVGGRLLAVHSDDPRLLLHFARAFLYTNLSNIHAAQLTGERKLPETSPHRPKTTLVRHLVEALQERHKSAHHRTPPTVTGYYFTNSGQGAELEIFPLPLEVSNFLQTAVANPKYSDAWHQLVTRAWEITKAKRGQTQTPPPRYNRLYEDLFALPQDAPTFIRRYFLRRRLGRNWGKGDPTANYAWQHETALLSWQLTELFLRKVMLMNPERIQHIRALGDALAEYIVTQNDRRFFRAFLTAQRYGHLRMALIKASHAEVKRGRPPLITLERFLAVFEEAEEEPYPDWKLGRDLVLIRLFEQLYAKGWLQRHAEEVDLPEEEEDQEKA
jgi:CRISPR-associated protein Cst1